MKAREPKQGKVEEIPTPEVWPVASYETDYLPVFTPPASYLRCASLPAQPADTAPDSV